MSMTRLARIVLPLLLGGALLLPCGLRARDNSASKDGADKNQDTKNLEKRQKELDTPYKKWLEEEVPYIITNEETRGFLQLQTNEEREQFIEAFWQRRNPDQDSVENEFKEEHYRRIAYANERFASGVPGWKTDRGRIYIIWGPPDEIDVHALGETYHRPVSEGGGQTNTYAYQDWRYRYMEGIGNNVVIEFVDSSSTGEFRISLDPGEKDALARIPGAGLSDNEAMGVSSKGDRFMRTDGSTAPLNGASGPTGAGKPDGALDGDPEFGRLDQYAKINAPPPVKFKDLEEVVSSRILHNQITFDTRYDFLRIAGDTVLVPITVEIQNKQMTFKNHDGVNSATLNLFARVSTLSGRVVQTFEDTIQQDISASSLEASLNKYSMYQKAVPLRPGLYKLDLVIKDVNSGNVGVLNTALRVSEIPDDKLEASSLILADEIEPVASRDIGIGQFVIGSTKIRPNMHAEFKVDQPLGVYMQFYNLKTDEKTHKNQVSVDMKVSQGQQTISREVVATGDELPQTGEQLTFERVILPKTLAPGKYKLDIQATDLLTHQTVSRSADFTVMPPAATNAAANPAANAPANAPGK